MKNHAAALNATPNLQILLIRRYMREKEWMPISLVKCVATFKHKKWYFGLKKQISLVKNASLTWQFTACQADQMLLLLNLWLWTIFCCPWSSWMAYQQCGFFHVSSNGLILNVCSHTGRNWMVYYCCGFFHVPSNCLMWSICRHTGSNWMVFHCYEFFHVSSNCQMLSICSHTGSSWKIISFWGDHL